MIQRNHSTRISLTKKGWMTVGYEDDKGQWVVVLHIHHPHDANKGAELLNQGVSAVDVICTIKASRNVQPEKRHTISLTQSQIKALLARAVTPLRGHIAPDGTESPALLAHREQEKKYCEAIDILLAASHKN